MELICRVFFHSLLVQGSQCSVAASMCKKCQYFELAAERFRLLHTLQDLRNKVAGSGIDKIQKVPTMGR